MDKHWLDRTGGEVGQVKWLERTERRDKGESLDRTCRLVGETEWLDRAERLDTTGGAGQTIMVGSDKETGQRGWTGQTD